MEKKSSADSGLTPKQPYLNRWLCVGALILALLALLLSVFCWQKFSMWQDSARRYFITGHQTVARLQENLQQAQVETKDNLLALQSSVTALQNVRPTETQKMIYSAFLVRLANAVFISEQNVVFTIDLLNLALQQLNGNTLPEANSLVQAINKDIATLNALEKIDVLHLAQQLNQINTDVLNLPDQKFQSVTSQTAPATPQNLSWWAKIKKRLAALFVIERTDHPTLPLIEAHQILFFKENISVELLQAKWGLLNRASAFYTDSLQKAINLLTPYETQVDQVKEIVKQLQTLKELNINLSNVELSSLSVLNKVDVKFPTASPSTQTSAKKE